MKKKVLTVAAIKRAAHRMKAAEQKHRYADAAGMVHYNQYPVPNGQMYCWKHKRWE